MGIEPCLPGHWKGHAVDYRYRGTTYRIEIGLLDDDTEPTSIELDAEVQPAPALALLDDGRWHQVRVRMARLRWAATVEGAME